MPSYSLRERRECPNCHCASRLDVCSFCGNKTELISKWSVRFQVKINGKVINKRLSGFCNREDAEQGYKKFISENNALSSKTFEKIFDEYITKMQRTLKGATIYNKRNIFQLHILPYFKEKYIQDLTKTDILNWRSQLLGYVSPKTNKPFSIKYINNIRAELCAYLNFVQEYYDLPNIVLNIKPLKKSNEKVKEMNFYDFEEFKKLLYQINRTKNEKKRVLYYAFFCTLYYTGARVGEILALSDDDIDLYNNTLDINKSLTRKTLNDDKYKITSPKNLSSIRKISLPNKLVVALRQFLEWKRKYNVGSQFLFGGDAPLSPYSYTLALKKYSSLARIKVIRIHDFRHSHASLLINLGANVALVSKRLGHTNTQQTLNTYSHLFPNSEQEIIKLINRNCS